MARKKAEPVQSPEDKLLEDARKRFKLCQDAETKNRERARKALKFRALEQWPDQVKRDREDNNQEGGPRPCLTLDKTNQYISQVKNDQRQNRSSIKVRPVDDDADTEVAEILNGVIRHIEDNSHADLAYDRAFEAGLDGGFGYWRLLTDYVDELSFDQEIFIKSIRNRFTVYLDPSRQLPDGSDSRYGFIIEDMDRDEFKRQYPDADPCDFDGQTTVYNDWITRDKVRVAEYFRIEPKTVKIHRLDTGEVVTDDKLSDAQKQAKLQGLNGEILVSRETTINQVKWSKLTAKEEIDSRDLPGKWIPIVEVVGNELDVDGERQLRGMIDESVQDSQRMHNYSMSAFVESVALAPRAPWTAAEGQIEGHENEWKSANRRNISVLEYKPVSLDGQPVPPPERQAPPGIPAGWQQLINNTEHGIQASLGMYQASVGAPSNEKSGKAILERKKEGDSGNFHYFDNLARSIRHTGRILISWIPYYYDTQRVLRIIGEDGDVQTVKINPDQEQAVQDDVEESTQRIIGKIYNLNVGTYDVTVSTGPAYSTKRQEAADFMQSVVQAMPDMLMVMGDIMFQHMDVEGAEEVSKRLKNLIQMTKPGLIEPDKDQPQQQDPRLIQAMQMIQQLQGQVQQVTQGMEAQKFGLEQYKAQTDRLKAQNEVTKSEQLMKGISDQLTTLAQLVGTHHAMIEGAPQ